MIEKLDQIDSQLFLLLNGLHNATMDNIMFRLTEQLYWIPLFLVIVYFIFRSYGWKGLIIILGVAITITLADQFTFRFMKPFFARLRPSHQPALEGMVHTVNGYKGGLYGFASSHAANSFGIAFYLYLTMKEKLPWIWIMFVWAAIFSYTRIYLGVHYPGDIVVGAIVGMIMGYLAFLLSKRLFSKFSLSE